MTTPASGLASSPVSSSAPDELAGLKDIHLPDAISWWPLAPGWWILLGLLITVVVVSILGRRYWLNNKAYRKEALTELQLLYEQQLSSNEFIEEVAKLIRRTAISTSRLKAAKTHIAQLQGKQWQTWLQQNMPIEQAEIIAISRYKNFSNIDKDALFQAAKQWIKKHKIKEQKA